MGALIPPIVNKLTTNGTAIVFVLSKLSQNVQNVKETVYSCKRFEFLLQASRVGMQCSVYCRMERQW